MKKQAQCQTPKRTCCLIHKGPALVLFVTVFVAMTICCVSLTLRAFVFLCSTVSRKKDAAPMETKRQKVRQEEGRKKGKIKLL